MARADLLIDLIKSGLKFDVHYFRKVVQTIIAEERSKQHNILADELEKLLVTNSENKDSQPKNVFSNHHLSYIDESQPQKKVEDLVLNKETAKIYHELLREQHRVDILRSYNLEPRNKILLIGPPGNGKTSLAEALARDLMVPFYTVRYDHIIGSYLGETATRLRKMIEFIQTRNCVLFFDEFETISKERGDQHETGEIKRVVSSLLLKIDSLPSYVIVIAATNHSELLDRAVWRRFQVKLELKNPTQMQIIEWLNLFEARMKFQLDYSKKDLAEKLAGLSFAEIEEFGLSILRQKVLEAPDDNIGKIISDLLKDWDIFVKGH